MHKNRTVLKAARTLRDGDTIGRLRRGFGSTQSRRPVDAMARAACFSRRQFHRLMVQVLGETPGTHQRQLRLDRGAWLLLTSSATVLDVALETGFENQDFYARLSHAIWHHAIRFSQESRKDTAAINTGCTFHRTPHSSCLRKHLTCRSRQPRTASAWKSQNHTPLSGKRSPATSIPGGRKISTSRNHRNALSLK